MLFVIHWEVDFEKTEGKLKESIEKIMSNLTANPEKYPKTVSKIYTYSGEPHKGFQVVEVDSAEQLTRFALAQIPYVKMEAKAVEEEHTGLWLEYMG